MRYVRAPQTVDVDQTVDVNKIESRGSEPDGPTVANRKGIANALVSPVWWLLVVLAAVGAGVGLSHLFDLHGIASTQGYLYGATALLALGLYGSTAQISLPEVRSSTRLIVLAVTVGVVAKAALITGVMYLVYREPQYLVLGVAVAQIDPLSVAALRQNTKLSDRAKAILYAWSSFDDPVTTLLTIYVAQVALYMLGRQGELPGTDLGSFTLNLLANFVFVAVAALVWLIFAGRVGRPMFSDSAMPRRQNLVAVALLVALTAVAVWQFLMLGLALAGLFVRPYFGLWLDRATRVALLLASIALGVLLLDGAALGPGLLLGGAAFVAQIVVAAILTRKLPRRSDRYYLALSQQNGITAIILALLLERGFPGTVAVIAPAILVINVLHVASTSVLTRVIK